MSTPDELQALLSYIKPSQGSYFMQSPFMSLYGALLLERARGAPVEALISALTKADADIRTLLTVLTRVEWQDSVHRQGGMNEIYWNDFLGCDLKLFHLAGRSAYDHIANMLLEFSTKPKQAPESFEGLRNWLMKKDANQARLGADLAEFVLSCSWFSDLRTVRDSLVHNGGMPVFNQIGGRPYFQVYESTAGKVVFPEHTIEGDLVDFQAYSAIGVARLLTYLERLTPLVLKRFPNALSTGGAFEFNRGYGLLLKWLPRADMESAV